MNLTEPSLDCMTVKKKKKEPCAHNAYVSVRSSFPSTIKTEECPTGRDEHEKWRLENRKGVQGVSSKNNSRENSSHVIERVQSE